MREQVLARFALTSGRKSFQEMVVEESIPNIRYISREKSINNHHIFFLIEFLVVS
jgi:hypothetical protein